MRACGRAAGQVVLIVSLTSRPAAKAAKFRSFHLGGTLRTIAACHVSTSNGRCVESAPTSTMPATLRSPTSWAMPLPSTTITRRSPWAMRSAASNG